MDPAGSLKYDFEFSWESTYGRAARLVRDHGADGVVVDLGCGVGTLAHPLRTFGIDHLGFEADRDSIEECHRRGVSCEAIDLADLLDAQRRVVDAVDGRSVAAVVLLDVVEHLPEPDAVSAALAALVERLRRPGEPGPLLVLSIPNTAHVDLGAKLVFGRWDVTDVGLLDSTHITLFTEERLRTLVDGVGFVEVAADDVLVGETEQRFPLGHPAVSRGTPVAELLRALRRHADPFGETYQFVRAYRLAESVASAGRENASADGEDTSAGREDASAGRIEASASTSGQARPRCTVVVTSTGSSELARTLDALGAQTERELELVVVTTPSAAPAVTSAVASSVEERGLGDRARVEIVDVDARCGLLDVGLAVAGGELVVFLGDGDVPDPDLVTSLCATALDHPGRLVRAQWAPDGSDPVGAGAPFGLLGHLQYSETPLGAVAVPTVAARALGLRFVDVGDGYEGWDFVARAASLVGVVECPAPTGVLVSDPTAGTTVPAAVVSSLDAEPVVLPAGAVADVRRAVGALFAEGDLRSELAATQARLDAVEGSRWWRLLAPLRSLRSRRVGLRR